MDRARHEASIERCNSGHGIALEDAIATLAYRNGLAWFTDEQIADIRELMVRRDWRSNRNAMASRKIHRENAAEAAWMDQQQRLMESGGPDNTAYRRDMIAAGRGHLLGGV